MGIELGFFGGRVFKQNILPTLRVCPPRGLCVPQTFCGVSFRGKLRLQQRTSVCILGEKFF